MANFAAVFLQEVSHVDDVVVSEDFKVKTRSISPMPISQLSPREGSPRSGTLPSTSSSAVPRLDLTSVNGLKEELNGLKTEG
jgi:hypothetical protein